VCVGGAHNRLKPYPHRVWFKCVKMSKSSNTEYIPLQVRRETWSHYCHPADSRYCQCSTCETLVKYPESLSEYGSEETVPHNVIEEGGFVHEKGKKMEWSNVKIKCKHCLENNVVNSEDVDIVMLLSDYMDTTISTKPEEKKKTKHTWKRIPR